MNRPWVGPPRWFSPRSVVDQRQELRMAVTPERRVQFRSAFLLQCRSGRITHHARHVTVEFRVPRTVDLPHPPAPMGAAQPWRQLLIYRLSLPAQKSLANGSTSAISKVMLRRSDRRTFIKAISGAVCASPFMLAAQSAAGGQAQLLTPLRFVVASDGHFGQPDTNYEKFHEEMMEWLNEEHRGKGLDFVVFNGDLIHNEPRLLPQVRE